MPLLLRQPLMEFSWSLTASENLTKSLEKEMKKELGNPSSFQVLWFYVLNFGGFVQYKFTLDGWVI